MTGKKPLVLDVDDTFLKTDILFEHFWAGLGQNPVATLKVTYRNFLHPARLKRALVDCAVLNVDLLPVNENIRALADDAVDAGIDVVLASASDEVMVNRLASSQGMTGRVFATDGELNLKGDVKAQALVAAYGEAGFHYAGNSSRSDRPIWLHSDGVIIAGTLPKIEQEFRAAGRDVTVYPEEWQWRTLLQAIRPHQWVKNALLILPVIAAHNFMLTTLLQVILGIMAFSAAASSIYIVNDLLDLEADRQHPKKRFRPFAAGTVPIRIGMMASFALGLFALGVGVVLGATFTLIIAVYMFLSLAYSLSLKRMRWVDIGMLASFYTIRVIAGAVAGGVDASIYMLVFIFPIFISLGCVKRLTELTLATSDERLPGRGYGRPDRPALLNVAMWGMAGALLIFFLYSFSAQAIALYPIRWLLWAALVPLAWWLFRMVRLGYLGKQDYDPIVFAMTDKRGLGILMIMLSLLFYAAGLWQQWLGI